MSKLTLTELTSIDGFKAAALVDASSGLALAAEGSGVDLELAAAGNTEVYVAKKRIINALGLNDSVEDILISLHKEYHLIRPLERNTELFLFLVLDRSHANLALARHYLKNFESNLDFS